MPDSNVTFIAVWDVSTYAVGFLVDGGVGGPADLSDQVYGSTITLPADPTRAGYTFAGWDDGSGSSYKSGGSFTMPDNDVTLTAVWTVHQHSITFNENDGLPLFDDESNVDYGSTYTFPSDPTKKPGYVFAGWDDGSGSRYKADDTFTMPDSNVTFIAVWSAGYHVYFEESGGASVSDLLQRVGSTVTLPTPSYARHDFAGWYSLATNGVLQSSGFTMPAHDLTLHAYWTANNESTVFFYPNGNGAVCTTLSQTATSNGIALVPAGCSWTDRTFVGWAESATATEITYGATSNYDFVTKGSGTSGNSILYAVWSGTVTFDKNAGDGSCASPQTAIGNGVPLTANTCTRANYTFKYWTTSSGDSGTKYLDAAPYNFVQSGSRTLYAQWASTTAVGQGPELRAGSEVGISSSNARVGRSVTSSTGRWLGIGRVTYAYAWLRCSAQYVTASGTKPGDCSYISGANRSSYKPVSGDRTYYLMVEITATDQRGSTVRYTRTSSVVR